MGRWLPTADACWCLSSLQPVSSICPQPHPAASTSPLPPSATWQESWGSIIGACWKRAPRPSIPGCHSPPENSLGIFLDLPVGTFKVVLIWLLRKAGIAVPHVGRGVPACHGEGIRGQAAISQLGHLMVWECVHTSFFLMKPFIALGPLPWLLLVLEFNSPLVTCLVSSFFRAQHQCYTF